MYFHGYPSTTVLEYHSSTMVLEPITRVELLPKYCTVAEFGIGLGRPRFNVKFYRIRQETVLRRPHGLLLRVLVPFDLRLDGVHALHARWVFRPVVGRVELGGKPVYIGLEGAHKVVGTPQALDVSCDVQGLT